MVIVAAPFILIFGILYPLKRRLEPQPEITRARVRIPFNAHPLAVAALALIVVALIGIIGYALMTNQFVDLMILVRDVVVLAYLFLLRLVAPFVVLYWAGTWLERKLNPDAARASPHQRARAVAETPPHAPATRHAGRALPFDSVALGNWHCHLAVLFRLVLRDQFDRRVSVGLVDRL